MEVLRSLSSWNDYVMDDAELLKDLMGLDQAPLFEDDADENFFPVSEDDSILTVRSLCVTWMTWWIRVQTSVTDTEPS